MQEYKKREQEILQKIDGRLENTQRIVKKKREKTIPTKDRKVNERWFDQESRSGIELWNKHNILYSEQDKDKRAKLEN